ncbi:MAG: ABC transporter permease [Candidatus Bathyarchaeia archaeon]
MTTLLQDTWHTFKRHMRASLREPVWIFFSMIQPLIWLVLYTQLFKDMTLMPGFPTDNYLQFFAPGLIVMLAVFSSPYSGFGFLGDINSGMLEKMLATPVSRYALILGDVLSSTTTLAMQALAVFSLSFLMGARVATGLGGVILTIIIVSLLGVGLASLSNALVIATKKEEPLVVAASLITLPLMFLSSVMLPNDFAPEWIQIAMKFNPVNYAIEAVRPLFLIGYDLQVLSIGLLILGIFALLALIISTVTFRKFAD